MSIVRYQLGGQCFPGEIWRVGVDVVVAGDLGAVTPAELTVALSNEFNRFNTNLWSVLKTLNRNGVDLSYGSIRTYRDVGLGPVLTGSYEATFTPVTGTATGATLSGSGALVATKLTQVATRSGRGRMYLPLTGAVLEAASGQVTDANCTTVANAVAAYFTAVDASSVILSGVSQSQTTVVVSKWPTAAVDVNTIDTVRVDSRLDRQNRRQRNTASQFTALAAVTV